MVRRRAAFNLVTAARELACNAIIYGGGGVATWDAVRSEENKVGVRLTFVDHGPEIPDVPLAMRVGDGTRITATRWK